MVEKFNPADPRYNTHKTREEKQEARRKKGTVPNNTAEITDKPPCKGKTRKGIKMGR